MFLDNFDMDISALLRVFACLSLLLLVKEYSFLDALSSPQVEPHAEEHEPRGHADEGGEGHLHAVGEREGGGREKV